MSPAPPGGPWGPCRVLAGGHGHTESPKGERIRGRESWAFWFGTQREHLEKTAEGEASVALLLFQGGGSLLPHPRTTSQSTRLHVHPPFWTVLSSSKEASETPEREYTFKGIRPRREFKHDLIQLSLPTDVESPERSSDFSRVTQLLRQCSFHPPHAMLLGIISRSQGLYGQ